MANISYRAASSMTNRYGYNGGNEYEDEGELNYSNTFYRKYDAQIGRFTGVDIKAEEFAGLTPYQFGGNNPVMFNDPMGDKFGGAHGERLSQLNAHPMGSEYEWSYDFGNSGGGWGSGWGEGTFSDFWKSVLTGIGDGSFKGKTIKQMWVYSNLSGSGEYVKEHDAGLLGWAAGEQYHFVRVESWTSYDIKEISESVGKPGLGESLIPIWGSGRAAIDDFQNGNIWSGIGNSILAVSDVFLVKSIFTGIGKLAVKGVATITAKVGAEAGTHVVYQC